jgi:hypothetical protein
MRLTFRRAQDCVTVGHAARRPARQELTQYHCAGRFTVVRPRRGSGIIVRPPAGRLPFCAAVLAFRSVLLGYLAEVEIIMIRCVVAANLVELGAAAHTSRNVLVWDSTDHQSARPEVIRRESGAGIRASPALMEHHARALQLIDRPLVPGHAADVSRPMNPALRISLQVGRMYSVRPGGAAGNALRFGGHVCARGSCESHQRMPEGMLQSHRRWAQVSVFGPPREHTQERLPVVCRAEAAPT